MLGSWGGISEDRAVTTAEDVEQDTEGRRLITISQGFLETSCFPSYQEARMFLLRICLQLPKGAQFSAWTWPGFYK